MSRIIIIHLVMAAMLATIGCTPRTVVTKDPGPHAKGIRYYRPKPYLLVSPFYPQVEVGANGETIEWSEPSNQYVTIDLQWLPDFSEEYALRVRTGLGFANVEVTLEDGWKLTGLNQTLDSQFNENITAIANLLKAAAPKGLVAAPEAAQEGAREAVSACVRATNVPLGYYEAILGTDPSGKKQIYGWRYLGFAPYETCPLAPCGIARMPCDQLDLYGLVFEDGVMTFKQLHSIALTDTSVDCQPAARPENVEPAQEPLPEGHTTSFATQQDALADRGDSAEARGWFTR